MNKKLLILPIILLLSATFALGADFYISKVDVKTNIFISETAVFNVTINNFHSTSDVFTFSSQDPRWIILTTSVEVPANSKKTFSFKMYPVSSVPLGFKSVDIKIKSERTQDFLNEFFTINIRPYDPIFGEYRPSIQFGTKINKEIDPRNKIAIEIYMRNRNALDIESLTIDVDGELFQGTKEVSLGPLEEQRRELLFEIDPIQKPGLYSLDVQLKSKNVTLNQATQNYEVISYSSISMDSIETSFLFKTTEKITLENLGNSETIKKVNLEMPWIKRLFTYSNPNEKTVRSNGVSSLEWNIKIAPQEYTEIIVTTNYRIPIGIILLIIIIIILYYILRSPVIVSKEALIVGPSKEGVEFLKIRIFIKNRSRKTIEKVTVFDRVPGIAELIKKKVLGTLQPEKVTKQEKKGTIIKWNLETLEPFEERIITYEIKSRLKIIGNISLPSTRVMFFDKNKERRIYSQRIIVSN